MWSGGVGASYRWSDQLTVFGDIFRGVSTPSPQAYVTGDVEEETSIGIELGGRWQANTDDTTHTVELVGFATWYDDLYVVDNVGGAGTGESENVGEVVSMGIELAAKTDLGAINQWAVANPWQLALTFTDATLDGDASSEDNESIFSGGKDGSELPYIPRLVFSLGTQVLWQQWGLGITAQYQSETYSTASNTSEQIDPDGNGDARYGKTDSYVLVDVSAWYQVTEQAKILAGIDNLLDEEYITSRHPHGARAGKPLAWYGGVELEW